MKFAKLEYNKITMLISYEEAENFRRILNNGEDRFGGDFEIFSLAKIKDIYPVENFFERLMNTKKTKKIESKVAEEFNKKIQINKSLEKDADCSGSNIFKIDVEEVAKKIASGYAYELHAEEINRFDIHSINSRKDFQELLEKILSEPTSWKRLRSGRLLFLSTGIASDIAVIFHPDNPSEGTCFAIGKEPENMTCYYV